MGTQACLSVCATHRGIFQAVLGPAVDDVHREVPLVAVAHAGRNEEGDVGVPRFPVVLRVQVVQICVVASPHVRQADDAPRIHPSWRAQAGGVLPVICPLSSLGGR